MDKTIIFVGDLHSQHQKLDAVLTWCEKEISNPYYVWLGDIFDSRLDNLEKNYPPYSDPQLLYNIIRPLTDGKSGILLQSNHQDKLKRFIGHELTNKQYNPVTVNQGLDYTISQFVDKLTIEEKEDLRQWLSALPYHVMIDSYDLLHNAVISFLCSHAYFNVKANLQTPSKAHQQEALYGLLESNNKRVDWWSSDAKVGYYDKPAVRIGGHYHVLFKGHNQRVIDAGCGSSNGSLCIHVPAYGLYKEF